MRLLLYCIALLLFVLSIVADQNIWNAAPQLRDLWYFAFLGVSIDMAIRLNGSWFILFPLYKAFFFLYRFLDLPNPGFLIYTDIVINIAWAAAFLIMGSKYAGLNRITSRLITIGGICWLLIALIEVMVLTNSTVFQVIYEFNFLFYILAAITGRVLSTPGHFAYLKPLDATLLGFALFFSMIRVLHATLHNFIF